MIKVFYSFGLALLMAACQQKKPVVATAAAAPDVAILSTRPSRTDSAFTIPADSLSPDMLGMLRQYNLSELFLSPQHPQQSTLTLDGFYGKEPERLSIALLQISRDTLKPNYFRVAGKMRYKKDVESFDGFIQVNRLTDFYDQSSLLSVMDSTSDTLTAHAYSAYAYFRFKTKASFAVQELSGRALLDFWVSSQGKLDVLHSPAKGAKTRMRPAKAVAYYCKATGCTQPPAKPSHSW